MVKDETKPNSASSTTEENKDDNVKTDEQPSKDDKTKKDEEKPAKKDETKKVEEPRYADALNKVKADYEKKITKILSQKDAEIKERDDIIRQLAVNGDEKPPLPVKSIHERIAEKRQFKKW